MVLQWELGKNAIKIVKGAIKMIKTIVKIVSHTSMILMLAGCSALPTRISADINHVSHPLAGWPVGPADQEDTLSQFNITGHWQNGRMFMQHSLGYKFGDQNGGGFYGPPLTYTGTIGVYIWERH